jgi:hypothetical protein
VIVAAIVNTAQASATRAIPGIGRLDFEQTKSRRDYWLLRDGNQRRQRLPSVTEILRACWPGSDRLLNWQGALGNTEAKRVRDEAADIGRDTHRFLEAFLRDGELLGFDAFPENRKPYLQGAAGFIFRYEPRPVADGIERLLCHPEEGYAGRVDFIGHLADQPDTLTLLDYKTSAAGNIYAKGHVQGCAYGLADERCGGDPIERIGVVGINSQGAHRIVWTPMREAMDVWASILPYYRTVRALERALGEGGS